MEVSLISIGNSKGVIIPKPIRSLVGLDDEKVDLSVLDGKIIISPITIQNKINKIQIKSNKKPGEATTAWLTASYLKDII